MMKSKTKIALLGGDLRQYTAAVALSNGPWKIMMWGLDKSGGEETEIVFCQSCEEALVDSAGVILPLPASTDGVFLNCPFDTTGSRLRLCELSEMISPGTVIVGGRIPLEFTANAEAKGMKVRDYFESEEFQIQNAYTTAEAAISIAMNSLDKNVCGAKFAITGYGRIAKHLVRLLKSLGAEVTVAARKESDLAWAFSTGCHVLKLDAKGSGLSWLSHGYDVIYNTVPHWLFDRAFLEATDKSTFIIDLASVPGGVDICAAKELGSNVLWATSLPGKYAPLSAGNLIASCVDGILREEVRVE
ncbi:MAG: hypothetical protein E7668_06415 [Ruminococcaceae bacterium]|nr:hypothetical protein [Oscillospiraceae bacterium]